jgi:hypothetical protein
MHLAPTKPLRGCFVWIYTREFDLDRLTAMAKAEAK